MIIPSIDIMDGKAVQLEQGKRKVLEVEDIMGLVERFSVMGRIALIDLDAALGRGDNLELVKKICSMAPCRVGGGIRTVERANELLAAGAEKVIIGTRATPAFLKQLPRDRVIVAVDTRGWEVVDNGWRNGRGMDPVEMIRTLEPYCSGFLFTDVEREGMMKGIDPDRVKRIAEATSLPVTVAGGISTVDELRLIEELGCSSQLGMSIYTGTIDLVEAFVELVDMEKGGGLVPTIVQDISGQVLMLAYSSPDSLREGMRERRGVYYSRSRNGLWRKGESSGNTQRLVSAGYDCDRDTLLFRVEQRGVACHRGTYSCFGDREFTWNTLYDVVRDRVEHPREDSYTSRISGEESSVMAKITEESGEVVNYTDRGNLVWEIADLMYFLTVLMARKGIEPSEIMNELGRRRK